MVTAMVRKAFKDLDIRSGPENGTLRLDKFALKVFKQLFYDWEVNKPLIASLLLGLLNHYSLTWVMITINIELLKKVWVDI